MDLFPLETSADDGWPKRMGFIDRSGTLVIPQEYYANPGVQFSKAGFCMLTRVSDNQVVIIDRKNTVRFTLPEHHISHFNVAPDENGLFPIVHRPQMDDPEMWKIEGRDRYYTGEEFHYAMTLEGEVAFEAKFSSGANGFYQIEDRDTENSRRTGIIDKTGRVTVAPQFNWMHWSRTDPVISIIRGGLFGVIDYHGHEVIPISHPVGDWFDVGFVTNGLVIHRPKGQDTCKVLDLSNAQVAEVPATYWSPSIPQACPTLSDGVMKITQRIKGTEGPSYFADAYGRYAMKGFLGRPRMFEPETRVGYFYADRATIHLNGKMGAIDKAGKLAVEPIYESVSDFRGGLARVCATREDRLASRISYIDTDGAVVATNH